jgi:hypothetical protein
MLVARAFAPAPGHRSEPLRTGLLPICNLRPKVIGINCESRVMRVAQSRTGFYESSPESDDAVLSLMGRPTRNLDRNFSNLESFLNQTSTKSL